MKYKAMILTIAAWSCYTVLPAQNYSPISNTQRLQLLEKPTKGADIVFDTDTYNEIDDQFALVYALLSKESFNLKAVYAAPFSNQRADNPALGMQLSYEEILRVFEKMKVNPEGLAFKGSTAYLTKDLKPEASRATDDLINRAMQYSHEKPLYVVAVGAITNVANAILLKPEITDNIVVVWLGGNAYNWPNTNEFNMTQDKDAANVILNSGVAFVQYPCMGVVSSFTTTVPEMEYYLAGYNDISNYLLEIFKDYHHDHFAWSKVLWDMTAVAYMINRDLTPSQLVHAPIVTPYDTYSFDENRHLIRKVYHINRDAVYGDFFRKLQGFGN
jgi:purine nucleosidase